MRSTSALVPWVVSLCACSETAPARLPRAAETDRTTQAAKQVSLPAPPATLPVAPRAQARESPPEGYCGETAIQEGLLLLGVYAAQTHVNRLGRPVHPDLYSNELPVALRALGVRFTAFPGGGYTAFVAFAREALAQGRPVVAGVKILPTAHPEWGLDHFVLVVGEGRDGLLVDTTWGTREETNAARTRGISLAGAGYGLRLDGVDTPAGTTAAHLAIVAEGHDEVTLRVACPGAATIEQRRSPSLSGPIVSVPAPFGSGEVRVPRDGATYFACAAAGGPPGGTR